MRMHSRPWGATERSTLTEFKCQFIGCPRPGSIDRSGGKLEHRFCLNADDHLPRSERRTNAEHLPALIQEDRIDRKLHEEGVNGIARLDLQPPPRAGVGSSDQSM